MSDSFGSDLNDPEYTEYLQACAELNDDDFVAWLLLKCTKTKADCLEWRGLEYPRVIRRGQKILVKRLVMQAKLGRLLGSGEQVRNRCKNKRCVNIEHLFIP